MTTWKNLSREDRVKAIEKATSAGVSAAELARELGTSRDSVLGFAFRETGGYHSGNRKKNWRSREGERPLYKGGRIAVGETRVVPLHETGRLFAAMSHLRVHGYEFQYTVTENGCEVRRVS